MATVDEQPPDLEIEAQHYKISVGSLIHQQQGS